MFNALCAKVWRTLIGIIDGTIMAYDSQFYQLLSTIPESKGCHLFAVHERTNTVVVVNKKKLSCYGWQSPGFVLRREVNLVDVPKSICCLEGGAVVGYKKFYECVDLSTGTASRLLDVEKECRMVALEVSGSKLIDCMVALSIYPCHMPYISCLPLLACVVTLYCLLWACKGFCSRSLEFWLERHLRLAQQARNVLNGRVSRWQSPWSTPFWCRCWRIK